MNSSKTLSIWPATYAVPKFNQLSENKECDVCIIGAGITGITTAYLTASEGKKVIVLDDGEIAGGETQRTTAHLTSVIDDRYYEIERLHGLENSILAAESEIEAINTIEKIIAKEKIDCDFKRVDGFLLFKPDDNTDLKEYHACIKAGVEVEFSGPPLRGFKDFNILKFPHQAQFHVLKYISALTRAITKMNGEIYTNTFVSEINDGESVEIKTKTGNLVKAKDAVIATNSPISDFFSIHTKQAAYRTYVIGIKIPVDSIKEALYWDTEDPYHYIRIYKEEGMDILIVGGEDHKTGQEENPEMSFSNLEKWSREHFDNLGEVIYKWSGQVMEPVDGLSFIGKDPENTKHVYVATGDSGMGMTHGTFSGLIIRDLIMERENKWADLYDPNRITIKAAAEFLKEGANLAAQYIDLVTPGEVKDISEIPKNSGAIIREGLNKVAVYVDGDGEAHKYSAFCTHLKCILQWNQVENSWDCPCHGSRYDKSGKVLNGPAISDMKKVE